MNRVPDEDPLGIDTVIGCHGISPMGDQSVRGDPFLVSGCSGQTRVKGRIGMDTRVCTYYIVQKTTTFILYY